VGDMQSDASGGFGSGYVELEGNFKDYELECDWGVFMEDEKPERHQEEKSI